MFVNDQKNEKTADKIFYSALASITIIVALVGVMIYGVQGLKKPISMRYNESMIIEKHGQVKVVDPFDTPEQETGLYYNHSAISQGELFAPEESFNSDRAQMRKYSELVNHPEHYNQGKIEVIDAILDWELDFIEGNVVKYIARSRHKSSRVGDLKKARWYLDYLIDKIEKE